MEMTEGLLASGKIKEHRSFFGLFSSFTYSETGGKLQCAQPEYGQQSGPALKMIASAKAGTVAETMARAGKLHTQPNGSFRLDVVYSAERDFVAVQLFHYADYHFTAASVVNVFEGEEASLLVSALVAE